MKYINKIWILTLIIIIATISNCIIGITYLNKYNNLKKEYEKLQTDYATLKIDYDDLLIEVNNEN